MFTYTSILTENLEMESLDKSITIIKIKCSCMFFPPKLTVPHMLQLKYIWCFRIRVCIMLLSELLCVKYFKTREN